MSCKLTIFQTIQKFKAGEYNVLVCTSIGEEGLDIGEVDVSICYDNQSTPIRMVSLSLKAWIFGISSALAPTCRPYRP